jgi:polysaccharide export outer membrane protein
LALCAVDLRLTTASLSGFYTRFSQTCLPKVQFISKGISVKVSGKRFLKPFDCETMAAAGLKRRSNQPIIGLTLLVFVVVGIPLPGMAQVPTFSPASGQVNTNSTPTEDAYTLGAGDRLRLDIFDVPEYSGEYTVLVDGTLNLPVVGSIPIQGVTLERASDVISSRYARYVRRPIVTLSLIAPRPLKIAVAGEVNRPGSYSVTLTDGRQFPTVTQAIQLAGGITQSAAVRQVEIRRRTPGSGEQTFNVNLWDLSQRGNLSQDVTLRDGDSVFIPTTEAFDPGEMRQLADASFAAEASQPLKVAVVGEVVRPGPYTVTGASAGATSADRTSGGSSNEIPTVTQAIQVAGGITQSADIRSVQVRRPTRNGSDKTIDVDLWQLLREGDLSQDVILQEGDTIVVPTATALSSEEATRLASASFSAAVITINVVGEVKDPGIVEVPANAPLNQALLAAGGFNNRARKGEVELIRLQPNGTVDKREVSVDFTEGINAQTNPPLRPNDVIVVNRSGIARFSDTLGTVLSPVGGIFSLFNFFRIFR